MLHFIRDATFHLHWRSFREKVSLTDSHRTHSSYISRLKSKSLALPKKLLDRHRRFPFSKRRDHRSTIILSQRKSTRSCDRAIFLGDACFEDTRNSGSVTGSMKRGIESILRNSHPCITSSFHLQQYLVCFHFPFSFPPRNCARIPRCEETPSRPRDRLNAKKRWQRGCSRIFPRERRGRVPGWICNAKGDVLGAIVELLGSLTRDECRLVLRIIRFSTIYHDTIYRTTLSSKFSSISPFILFGILVSWGVIFLWNFVELNWRFWWCRWSIFDSFY